MIANGPPSGANPAMGGRWQVDQVAAKSSKERQRSVLIRIRIGKSRIADNVDTRIAASFRVSPTTLAA
jgi:hypothetical protein